ncbi:MAG: hypothetical protein SGI88_02775 [Candidatus Hydrogenedentes bacterium]|nr:hypothetical protein [Candidatus Hydrogenedentota bacterium]
MRRVTAVTLLGFCCAYVSADAQEPSVLPAMPQATMQMPWSEFRAMWDALETAEAETAAVVPKPPVQWSVVEADYAAEARADNASVKITARFHVQIWEPVEWVRIPLIGDGVAVTEVTFDDAPANLTPDEQGRLTLLHQGSGEHTVTMTFYVTTAENEGVVSFEFPCQESAVTRMMLRVPVKDARVQASAASNTELRATESGVEAELAFPKTQKLAVSWTLPAKLPATATFIEPRVACTSWTLVSLAETYVSCATQLRFQLLRGAVDSFAVDLPGDVNVLDVAGQGSAWSRQDADGKQRIQIKTNHQISDSYDVIISYERPFSGELVDVPIARVSDVVRETGYVGISARGNVEVSPAATIEGLTRLDAAELPVELRAMSPTPVLLAFRHGEGERLLAVDVRRLEDVAVPDSTIEYASITTLVTEDGMAVTRASYEVRNSVRQFLRVRVDEKAEIWSALVGDRVVKPARDATTGEILIPLSKSVEVDRRLGSFPVHLLYMERIAAPKGLWSTTNLSAPATDIFANSVEWEVQLPEQRPLYRATGDLERIDVASGGILESAREQVRPVSTTRQERLHRLREGVQRFLITDINSPIATSEGNVDRYSGQKLSPEQTGAGKASSSIAGVLPVSISLPEAGYSYRFGTILAEQGKPLSLSLTTLPRAIPLTLRYTVLGFALLLGVTLARLAVTSAYRKRFGRRAATVLAVGIGTVACAVYVDGVSLLEATVTIAGSFVLVLFAARARSQFLLVQPAPEVR